MWVDPDSGKTWEQLCETVWRQLTPAMQAMIVALEATQRGGIIRRMIGHKPLNG